MQVSVAGASGLTLALLLAVPLAGCDSGSSFEDETMMPAPSAPVAGSGSGGAGPSPSAGTSSAAGAPPSNVPPPATVLPSLFGTPTQSGAGTSSDRWKKSDVQRNELDYYFMSNGWGPGFESQTVSWSGTSFSVDSMQGKRGEKYEPASYPTVFCGAYSDSRSGECGLPKAIASIASLRTGWRWSANGNAGQYNAAYDIWLSTDGNISGHSAFLMVWLRDPPGQQPAGQKKLSAISVSNAPGTWDVWAGNVNGKPCVSYVRREGQDSPELEIDALDFVRDTQARQISLPGSTVLSVAVGFEIWSGPITALKSDDFYVHVE